MTELAKADHQRLPGDAKLPPMPATYFYPKLTQLFPDLDTRTCASLERAVKRKYKAVLYQVLWQHAASLPTYRYPTPYPVHNQAWRPSWDQGNRPLVSLPLGRGAEKRWQLRLKGGPNFARQVALFRQFVEGAALKSEAKIYRRGNALLVGLVGRFPPPLLSERTRLMRVLTSSTCLWVVEIEGQEPRYWNHDDLRRLCISHRAYLQRIAEDSKYELRLPPGKLRHIREKRQERCQKHQRRIHTSLHQLTAQLVGLAERQKVARVIYTDHDKSWLPLFPWSELRRLLAYKLQGLGITFGGGDEDPNAHN
jgi:hypothetical protein